MKHQKLINGLLYTSQGDLSELLGIERHSVKNWQMKYDLPVIEEEKLRFYCIPVYLHWFAIRETFKDRGNRLPLENTALCIAISHLVFSREPRQTASLLEKGLNIPKNKTAYYLGMAAEWTRANLGPGEQVML